MTIDGFEDESYRLSMRMRTLDAADAPKVRVRAQIRHDKSKRPPPPTTPPRAARSLTGSGRRSPRGRGRRPRRLSPGPADAGRPEPRPGQSRLAAGLTPKGKLLYFGRLVAGATAPALRPGEAPAPSSAHLRKYAAFQKATVRDAHGRLRPGRALRPGRGRASPPPDGARSLPPDGEFAGELLAPARRPRGGRTRLARAPARSPSRTRRPRSSASRPDGPASAPDATDANLPDEVGPPGRDLDDQGLLRRPGDRGAPADLRAREPAPGRLPLPGGARAGGHGLLATRRSRTSSSARVTSAVVSPRFGPIGLGFVFRDVADGAALRLAAGARRGCADRRAAALRVSSARRDAALADPRSPWPAAQVGLRALPDLRQARPRLDSRPRSSRRCASSARP